MTKVINQKLSRLKSAWFSPFLLDSISFFQKFCRCFGDASSYISVLKRLRPKDKILKQKMMLLNMSFLFNGMTFSFKMLVFHGCKNCYSANFQPSVPFPALMVCPTEFVVSRDLLASLRFGDHPESGFSNCECDGFFPFFHGILTMCFPLFPGDFLR